MPSSVGPRELYPATVSSSRLTVFHVFSAPTVIAAGELPGDVTPATISTPSEPRPRLPADVTTTMPAATTRAMDEHIGSTAHGAVIGCPSERLTTRIL